MPAPWTSSTESDWGDAQNAIGGGGGSEPIPEWIEITGTTVSALGATLNDPDSMLTSLVYSGGQWDLTWAGTALIRDGFEENWPHISLQLDELIPSFTWARFLSVRLDLITMTNTSLDAGPGFVLYNPTGGAGGGWAYTDHNGANTRWHNVASTGMFLVSSATTPDQLRIVSHFNVQEGNAMQATAYNQRTNASENTFEEFASGNGFGTDTSLQFLEFGGFQQNGGPITAGTVHSFRLYYSVGGQLPPSV